MLIFLNAVLLTIVSGYIWRVSRFVSAFFWSYLAIFIIVLPVYYQYLGGSFVSVDSSKQYQYLFNINLINFCFLLTVFCVFMIFKKIRIRRLKIDFFEFKRLSDFILPFSVLFAITILMKIYIFNDVLYFLNDIDIFERSQELKRGGWFFLVLSSALWYGSIGFLFYLAVSNKSNLILFFLLVLGLYFIIFFGGFASRTSVLLLLLGYYIFIIDYLQKIKINITGLLVLMFFVVVYLIIYDQIRQGISIYDIDIFSIFNKNILESLMISFLQVENATVLIEYFEKNEYIGLQTFFLTFTGYGMLPSFLLPFEKINTGVESILTSMIFGENLNPIIYKPNSTLTFSLPVTGYAEYGYIGVFVSSSFYAVILAVSIFSYNHKSFLSFVLLIFTIQLILAFRLSMESIFNTLYLYIVFFTLFIFLKRIRFFK